MSQELDKKVDDETMKLILNAPDKKGDESGALIILKEYRFAVNEKKMTKTTIRILGKVYSRDAIPGYSQIPLRYSSYYEEPVLEYARVIYKDGSTREVRSDAVQIKNLPEMEGYQFTDVRYISFAFSGLEPGAAFDYRISFTAKKQTIENEWYENYLFVPYIRSILPPYKPRIDPCLVSKFILTVPRGWKFQSTRNLPMDSLYRKNESGMDEYTWSVKDIPASKIEPDMPPISDVSPFIWVTSLRSWQQVDSWAASKILSKIEQTPEIKSKVLELIRGKLTFEDKLKAIANYIQSSINYVYTDLERGGFEAHRAGEVLKSRYGDCKDQTVLFVSMLRTAGINAWPALVNPFPVDEFDKLPNNGFTHLITCVSDSGKDIFLDMTSTVTPFPELPITDQGRTVFILNGTGGRLGKTPKSKVEDNVSNFQMVVTFARFSAFLTMNMTMSGLMSDASKSVFSSLDASSLKLSMEQFSKMIAEKASIDSVYCSDVKDPQVPFRMMINFHIDSAWKKYAGRLSLAGHTSEFLSSGISTGANTASEIRKNDYVIYTPVTIRGSEKYFLPEKDMLVVTMPHNDTIRKGPLVFWQNFEFADNSFVSSWSFTIDDTIVPREQYSDFINTLNSLKKKAEWTADIVDPASNILAVIRDENPETTIGRCNSKLREDPGNIYYGLLLAMAYYKENQYDQCIRKCKEVLAVSPGNKYAHFFMAYPYYSQKNIQMSVTCLSRALAIDPIFEHALSMRAGLFAELKMFDKALADVETGLKADPLSILCLQTKSLILSSMGLEDEALMSILKIADTDSSNVNLLAGLAELCLQRNNADMAIKLYEKALRKDIDNPNILGNLGWAWYLKDEFKKCIEYSEKAASLKNDSWYARFNIALSYLCLGDIARARSEYSKLTVKNNGPTFDAKIGAIKDLNNLKAKGKWVKESKAILKDYFNQ